MLVTDSQKRELNALLDDWFDVDATDAESLKARNKSWFASTPDQDAALAARYGDLARDAAAGLLDAEAATPRGRLALIILLDQFPRNLHRGTQAAFAGDPKALRHCLDGVREGMPAALEPLERIFFCMPMQHSESREIQALSVETFEQLAHTPAPTPLAAVLEGVADYARMHRDIVERFGRFPHRNRVLGRESTEEELEFLASGGPSFGQ